VIDELRAAATHATGIRFVDSSGRLSRRVSMPASRSAAGRVARGISAPGPRRSRRNCLQLPGSCHPDHQTDGAEVVHFQCANMRGCR
jgi:hypothetical protein